MKTETATHARINFGKVLENSLIEPVIIEKSGRKLAVILSFEEYERISSLEDKYWLLKAKKAEQDGFIGTDAGEALIRELLDAKD